MLTQAYQVLSDEFKKRVYDIKDCRTDGKVAQYDEIHPEGHSAYFVARKWINAYHKDKVATLFDWYGEPYNLKLTPSMAQKFNFVGGPGQFKKKGQLDEREAEPEDHGTLEAVNETIRSGGWTVLQAIILRKPLPDKGGGGGKKGRCVIS